MIAAVAGQPEEHAVNYAVLRSMQKAIYSPEEEGHYALNSEDYCHFTSPIRRYPDLTIHRCSTPWHRGKKPRDDFDEHGAARRALQRARAAGRGGRARAEEGQAALVPQRADRRCR